jgi:hypothetical protein
VRILNVDRKSVIGVGVFQLQFVTNGDSIEPFFTYVIYSLQFETEFPNLLANVAYNANSSFQSWWLYLDCYLSFAQFSTSGV